MKVFIVETAVGNIKQPTVGMPLYKSSCLLNMEEFVSRKPEEIVNEKENAENTEREKLNNSEQKKKNK